ncbi:MAG: GIY-YIG nuclease family protein [Proteobacteria bacterium]|nr:GIY-YIG nuclease family protein [Pseudomonadota bacterium]
MKEFWVYIMASDFNGTLYVGVTSNIVQRVFQHKTDAIDGFTKEHGIKKLIFLEKHESAESAITREKRIKAWKREWKMNLVEKENPQWIDLAHNWYEQGKLQSGSLPTQG